MKLVFIRHGDPDYRKDGLTETGVREAQLLQPRMKDIAGDYFYVSPLGRAAETAQIALEGTGIEPVMYPWMMEFCPKKNVIRPDRPGQRGVCWDWLPQDYSVRDCFYDAEHWMEDPAIEDSDVKAYYAEVCGEFDRLLEEHGYKREGRIYRAIRPNNDTLVFFCHFGVTCVFLSHLMNVSPMVLWHSLAMAPSSVTSLITEERREGIASFRANKIGDISHLYVAGVEPSFSARFCETYANADERHD